MDAKTGELKTSEELEKLSKELAEQFLPITQADYERLRRFGTAEERKRAFEKSLEEVKIEESKKKIGVENCE